MSAKTILGRVVDAVRVQDWTAIAVELVIVVMGVFVGTLVANWNERRLEKNETDRLLIQLQPELHDFISFFDSARQYFATTRRYADTAFAGWERQRALSDSQFVVAAYQSSQIYGLPNNGQSWALIFGGQQLRNIDDLKIRRDLSRVMTFNYNALDFNSLATPYRQHVREVIPTQLQEEIRRACGDRTHPEKTLAFLSLPSTCNLQIPAAEAASTAAKLRARPELADELRWQLAAEAVFLSNVEQLEAPTRALSAKIDATYPHSR